MFKLVWILQEDSAAADHEAKFCSNYEIEPFVTLLVGLSRSDLEDLTTSPATTEQERPLRLSGLRPKCLRPLRI